MYAVSDNIGHYRNIGSMGGLSHSCPICNKHLAIKTSIKRHIQTAHSTNEATKCSICDRVFKNKFNMWVHRSRTHRIMQFNNLQRGPTMWLYRKLYKNMTFH